MEEIKFIPIYKGKFNKVAKPSLIKRILKVLKWVEKEYYKQSRQTPVGYLLIHERK